MGTTAGSSAHLIWPQPQRGFLSLSGTEPAKFSLPTKCVNRHTMEPVSSVLKIQNERPRLPTLAIAKGVLNKLDIRNIFRSWAKILQLLQRNESYVCELEKYPVLQYSPFISALVSANSQGKFQGCSPRHKFIVQYLPCRRSGFFVLCFMLPSSIFCIPCNEKVIPLKHNNRLCHPWQKELQSSIHDKWQ